jgi:hypothetical protein
VFPKYKTVFNDIFNNHEDLLYVLADTHVPIFSKDINEKQLPVLLYNLEIKTTLEAITYKFSVLSSLDNNSWETLATILVTRVLRVYYSDKANEKEMLRLKNILINNPCLILLMLLEITPNKIDPYFLPNQKTLSELS